MARSRLAELTDFKPVSDDLAGVGMSMTVSGDAVSIEADGYCGEAEAGFIEFFWNCPVGSKLPTHIFHLETI